MKNDNNQIAKLDKRVKDLEVTVDRLFTQVFERNEEIKEFKQAMFTASLPYWGSKKRKLQFTDSERLAIYINEKSKKQNKNSKRGVIKRKH